MEEGGIVLKQLALQNKSLLLKRSCKVFSSSLVGSSLDGLVADYILNGDWNFPSLLQLHFPGLCDLISGVPIALSPIMPDKLIWVPSASGELTAKDAFHFLRPRLLRQIGVSL